ncbi:MAG: hypothetical protein FJY92_11790, partial [Candidatus Hydrogenedentes bacterium]|nr:hypothetical protein [Candidatus Hydrogenedentota bacterium]
MGTRTVFVSAIMAMLAAVAASARADIAVANLRCEYRENPLGIDVAAPRLSWRIELDRRGAAQSAYQLLVATKPDLLEEGAADLWDPGKRASDQSVLVPYDGKPLASRQPCFWKVRVWDESGAPSAWSPAARWTMGLLHTDDWTAQWIGQDEAPPPNELSGAQWIWYPDNDPLKAAPVGSRYFRGTLDIPAGKTMATARAFVTADNSAVVYVNGIEVGKIADYHTAGEFDIASHVRAGRNCIAIRAENFGTEDNTAGLIGVVRVTFADGPAQSLATDAAAWRAARDEQTGWTAPAFDDSSWSSPVALGPAGMPPWGDVGVSTDRRLPARMLRRTVQIEKPVRSAFVYMSGLGLSELYVNGGRVGDHVLSPALSEYEKRVYYVTH